MAACRILAPMRRLAGDNRDVLVLMILVVAVLAALLFIGPAVAQTQILSFNDAISGPDCTAVYTADQCYPHRLGVGGP